ncbi:DUF3080 domain-containing protein [Salinimonas sp. HHU 13199]|uniref:DUF3080 domain-containing protein n=1 Tax=Salinimonas profundi TaxID=2729140 RepID=A0ABR8LF41_9ALTE|nr:DUF3080 family protein [Salinimonas profundi]MBD3584883.1 DUF3080 domain-containing protein [Salinimonas profundi]
MPVRNIARQAVLVLLILLLCGCTNADIHDDLQEYQDRITHVLDISLPEPAPPAALEYPDAQAMFSAVESFNVNLREFYRLQECELGTLVAQRNTALGKTAHPSQRYVYEVTLLEQLQQCSDSIDDPALKEKLLTWRQAKQSQRPAFWANLVQTSQETRAAFGRSTTLLATGANSDAGAAISALSFLNKIESDPAVSLSALERELKVLDASRLPARVWRTQRYIATYLNHMSKALTTHLPELACPAGKPSEQVKILRNVFYLFFIEKIQPVGSKLNQYHYQMMPVWEQWIDNPALSDPFKTYLEKQTREEFARYQQAIREHVTLWQTLFSRCNLSPTAPGQP